jgi:hypothetical protein
MSEKELKLLKELVRMGFDMEFSRRCDDFDMELLADFDSYEIADLSTQFSYWNGDPEYADESERFVRVGMRSAGKFLFAKLMKSVVPA